MDEIDINWNKLIEEDDVGTIQVPQDESHHRLDDDQGARSNGHTPINANPKDDEMVDALPVESSSSVVEPMYQNSIIKQSNIHGNSSDDSSTVTNLRGPELQIPSADGRSCRFKAAQSLRDVHALTSPDVARAPALLQGSAGIFIGQIPITYSSDDLRNMLVSLAAEKGVAAEIKEIKIHPRNTCAFVLVNRAALKPIVSYSKQVLCDSTCVWVGETVEAGVQLSELAAQTHAGQAGRTMLGVPKTTVVMEACSRSRRPRMDGGTTANTESAPSYASVFPTHQQPAAPQYSSPLINMGMGLQHQMPNTMVSPQHFMQQQQQYVMPQQQQQYATPPMQHQQQFRYSPQPQFMAPQQQPIPMPQQQQMMQTPTTGYAQNQAPPVVYQYSAQHGQQIPCVPMIDRNTGSVIMVPLQQQQQQPVGNPMYY